MCVRAYVRVRVCACMHVCTLYASLLHVHVCVLSLSLSVPVCFSSGSIKMFFSCVLSEILIRKVYVHVDIYGMRNVTKSSRVV